MLSGNGGFSYNIYMHVLSIGSSVIDLFLDLDKDHYKTVGEDISLKLGDKIPSDVKSTAVGGNGANVSVGLSRLEIPTTFYTYLGNDFFSREIELALSREQVAVDAERHDTKNSLLHIILDFPEDRIIISNYGKNSHDFKPREKYFEYIFLTSIPEEWESTYKKILEFSKENNIPIAFSPGTRQIENKNEIIPEVLKNTKIYFSNLEEAQKILEKDTTTDIRDLLMGLKGLGPEIVSITDGDKGSFAIDKQNKMYNMKPSPAEGKEKTGAGDAYASGFFAAILHGQDVPTAMNWGALNAGAVMQQVGAQAGLLTKVKLDEQLKMNNNLKAESL